MNVFDVITAVALVWAVVSGWRNGLVAQLLSLAGIVAGLVFAVRFGARVGVWLGIDMRFAAVAGFVVTFVATIIMVAILTKFVRTLFSFIGLKSLDTILGITFSIIKAVLILSVAYAAFASLNADMELVDKKYVAASRTFAPIKGMSESIFPYIEWVKEQIPDISAPATENKGDECELAV